MKIFKLKKTKLKFKNIQQDKYPLTVFIIGLITCFFLVTAIVISVIYFLKLYPSIEKIYRWLIILILIAPSMVLLSIMIDALRKKNLFLVCLILLVVVVFIVMALFIRTIKI